MQGPDTGLCGNPMQEGGEKPQAVLIPGTSSQLSHSSSVGG